LIPANSNIQHASYATLLRPSRQCPGGHPRKISPQIFAVSPVYWKSLPERDRMWVSQEDAVHPARSHRNAGAQAF